VKKKTNIVFRCDAGLNIGMGHFARCAALASWLDDEAIRFVVGADERARPALASRADTISLPQGLTPEKEPAFWREQAVAPDAIVFDLSYPARVTRRAETLALMMQLGEEGTPRIVIDAVGSQTLVEDDAAVDVVVMPYLDVKPVAARPRTLAGADYFLLPKGWPSRPERDGGRAVRRVLITMGGSDPHRLTMRALRAVMQVAQTPWTIRVVIGPAFDRAFASDLRACASADVRIEAVEAPRDLAEQLQWADLGVTTTGLTKYELAWAGLPSVQISIDRLHYFDPDSGLSIWGD